jgi:acylphosphatase
MAQTAKHVIFRGRVQGVGFRYTTHRIAGRYKVTGFVRNLPDGTVEMLVQGDPTELDHCIADVQSEFAGYIHDTRIEPAPYNPRYTVFRIAF